MVEGEEGTIGELTEALDSYRDWLDEDPRRADVTLAVTCELVDGVEVEASVGRRHVVKVDEPRRVGGRGTAPNPVNYALAALGSCAAIGFGYWSDLLEIPFDSVQVHVEGDVDPRGTFGFDDETARGFSSVRVMAQIAGPESPERYEELARTVDAHSPLLELFTGHIPVTTSLELID